MGAAVPEIETPVQGALALKIDTDAVAEGLRPDVSENVSLMVYAEHYEIVDQATADFFASWRNELDTREKAIIAKLAPAKKAAHEAHQRICSLENEALLPIRGAKQVANRKLGVYQAEQERIAAAERARLQKEAREKEEAAKLQVAEQLEAEGEKEAAEAVISEPVVIAPVAVAKPAVSGVTFRETFRAEVVDKMALIRMVAKGPALLHLLDVNLTALNQLARAQKERLDLPGVRVIKEKQVARGR